MTTTKTTTLILTPEQHAQLHDTLQALLHYAGEQYDASDPATQADQANAHDAAMNAAANAIDLLDAAAAEMQAMIGAARTEPAAPIAPESALVH